MRQISFLWLFTLLILTTSFAQETLNNDSVIKLVRSGLSEDAVANIVQTQPGNYSTGTDDIARLRKAGVSDRLIAAMLQKETPEIDSPKELGIFWKKGDNWIRVLPEVVEWQTGGVAKNHASFGVVKPDVNALVYGAHSHTRVGTDCEFLIRMPEQTDITEYQLIRLHEKKDTREFRMITGGVIHRSGGPRRDLVPFDFQKVSEQTYVVRLTNLAPGEFGFLLPTDARVRRRIYSFSVME
jgi:transposase